MYPPVQSGRWPLALLRAALLMVLGLIGRAGLAVAQEPQFLFTVAPPEVNVSRPTIRASAVRVGANSFYDLGEPSVFDSQCSSLNDAIGEYQLAIAYPHRLRV